MLRAYATFNHLPGLEMSLSNYLHKRPNSQQWQLRMMIPKHARAVVGRAEFTRSLRTADRREAEVRAYPILAEWKRMVAGGAGAGASYDGPSYEPSTAEIEEAALMVGYEEAGVRLNALIQQKARLGDAAYTALATAFDRRHKEAVRNLHAGEQGYWIAVARRQVAKRHWLLPEDGDGFRTLVDAIQRCGIDLFASARSKIAGNDDGRPSEYVQNAIQARRGRAKAGEGIMDLYDRYAAQRLSEGRKKRDSLEQDRKIVGLFDEFVGSTRSLKSIEQSEVRDWRNTVRSLPIAYKKKKMYAALSMREASALAIKNGERGLALNSVNKYLSAISALFVWATREGYAERNPCDGLFYDVEKGANARPPFSAEQLNTILASPLFTGFERDGKEFRAGDRQADDWRFWCPLVAMFTGARIGEVAQLYVDDVQSDGEHNFIVIRNDRDREQGTKNGQDRIAPIHSMLEKIGFLSFVKRQRDKQGDKFGPLFPELNRNERHQMSLPSRFWRTYLTRIGIKDGSDGFGSHSFRHGLADQLRTAGCLDTEVAVAIGHKQKTVTSGYGRIRQGSAARLARMIEGATFEGVDFTSLIKQAHTKIQPKIEKGA